jgi:hypothetical protein
MSERLYSGKPFPVKGHISKEGYLQVFCPFCGEIHTHGTEQEQIEPGVFGPIIGCRVPHCYFFPVDEHGYDIVEASRDPIPAELRRLAKVNERRRYKSQDRGKPHTPYGLLGWIAGWEPGTAPGPDWEPHLYEWCDIDEKWRI